MLDLLKDLMDPPISGHRLCFIHVPKCAGTTLTRAVHAAFSPWRGRRIKEVFWLSEPAARDCMELSGRGFEDTRSLLLDYALSHPDLRCVLGHLVVSPKSFQAHRETWAFVTVLRDPVERWVSHYFYNLNAKGPYAISCGLEEFLETPRAANLGMQYAIYLGGGAIGDKCTDEAIQRTIDTLQRFALVGRVDQLGDFVGAFQRFFGKRLRLERLNAGERRGMEAQAQALEAHLPRIRDLCRPDRTVYEAVCEP